MFPEVDDYLFGHGAAEYSEEEDPFAQNSSNEDEMEMQDGYKIGDFGRMLINWDSEEETHFLLHRGNVSCKRRFSQEQMVVSVGFPKNKWS